MSDPKEPDPTRRDTRFEDEPEGEYDAGRGGTRDLGRDHHGRPTGDEREPRGIDDGEVPEDDRRPTTRSGYEPDRVDERPPSKRGWIPFPEPTD